MAQNLADCLGGGLILLLIVGIPVLYYTVINNPK